MPAVFPSYTSHPSTNLNNINLWRVEKIEILSKDNLSYFYQTVFHPGLKETLISLVPNSPQPHSLYKTDLITNLMFLDRL